MHTFSHRLPFSTRLRLHSSLRQLRRDESPYFFQRARDGSLDFSRAVAAQFSIHSLQTPDEVEHFFARMRSAGGIAKMRAAAERPVSVNQAATGLAFEQRAGAVGGFGKFPAPGGAKAPGGDERLAFGELRRQAGELELATFGARPAGAFQRPLCQFRIDHPHFTEGIL